MADQNAASDASQLDKEIAVLRKQAVLLRKTLQIQCSTILSSASITRAIRSSSSPAAARRSTPAAKLKTRSARQQAYMQQCIYRIAAPVTSFKVRDPDPNAVDGGHVLGLRFEIMSRGQFLRPYYVMLNRPFAASAHLRVHRHTVPPAVPLAGLAARFLPAPARGGGGGEDDGPAHQDLERFVRMLRREIVRYHNRLGVSADLRRRLGLQEAGARTPSPTALVELGIADIEAKQINLTWADERTARLVMDDDGKVVGFVVFGPDGRDWEASSAIFSPSDSVEDVTRKLEAYMNVNLQRNE